MINSKIIRWLITGVQCIGVGATAYFAVRDTNKLNKKRSENPDLKLTKKDIIKNYIPTICCATGTIGMVGAGVFLSHKAEMSLLTLAAGSEAAYNRYGYKVKKFLGTDKAKELEKKISKDIYDEKKPVLKNTGDYVLFYIENIGFCKGTLSDLYSGIYNTNARLYCISDEDGGSPAKHTTIKFTTLKHFIDDCKILSIDDKEIIKSENGFDLYDYTIDASSIDYVSPYNDISKPSIPFGVTIEKVLDDEDKLLYYLIILNSPFIYKINGYRDNYVNNKTIYNQVKNNPAQYDNSYNEYDELFDADYGDKMLRHLYPLLDSYIISNEKKEIRYCDNDNISFSDKTLSEIKDIKNKLNNKETIKCQ